MTAPAVPSRAYNDGLCCSLEVWYEAIHTRDPPRSRSRKENDRQKNKMGDSWCAFGNLGSEALPLSTDSSASVRKVILYLENLQVKRKEWESDLC